MKEPHEQFARLPAGAQWGRVGAAELALDAGQLARSLGYRRSGDVGGEVAGPTAGAAMPRHVGETAAAMLARGRELLEPAYLWIAVSVRVDAEAGVVLCRLPRPVTLSVGRIIGAQLRGSEAIAAFVVTIGPRLEQEARALMTGGRALEGYILDAVGSLAAEAAADVLEARVAASAAGAGWGVTNRFSPGYCSWGTADQHALFSLLPERPAGVTLGESALMTPIKSVSGVIGLGPGLERRPYPCESCGVTTCHQRLADMRLGPSGER